MADRNTVGEDDSDVVGNQGLVHPGAGMIDVEVVCAVEGLQKVISVELSIGSTLGMAISSSDILSSFPALDKDDLSYGVYGKTEPETFILKDGDRVEIYRPLLITPMEARRLRAKRKKEASSK